MRDEIASAWNPFFVLRSALRVSRHYGPIAVLSAGLAVATPLVAGVVSSVPVLGFLVGIGVGLYLLTVPMRLIGNLYRLHSDRLSWF